MIDSSRDQCKSIGAGIPTYKSDTLVKSVVRFDINQLGGIHKGRPAGPPEGGSKNPDKTGLGGGRGV